MEFLRLIFSSFWVWTGFIILIAAVFGGVQEVVKVCKRSRKITMYRIGERQNVVIENASAQDVDAALYGHGALETEAEQKGKENCTNRE